MGSLKDANDMHISLFSTRVMGNAAKGGLAIATQAFLYNVKVSMD